MPKDHDEATTNKNPDAAIFEMVRRHDEVQAAMASLGENDRRIPALSAESVELAHRILIFPVVTDGALTEKKRIVAIEDLEIQSNHMLWKTGPDFVEFVYRVDAARIASAG
jgi:hypothetical protein